jgi:Trypsin-like peptidase domain
MKPRGTQLLQQLPAETKTQLLVAGREMARLARDYAVPIILAPPQGVEGRISSATGFGLRLDSGTFIGTAHHVLYGEKDGYVDRIRSNERVNWQVGNLPPFDPLSRIAWQDPHSDVVLLRISEHEAAAIGPCIISSPPKWPPDRPQIGELVLIAGYPKVLREENREQGWIGTGPLSGVFQVTDLNEPFYGCVVAREDLVSFDGPLPDPDAKIGGMSGAPVLRVGKLDYPLVGVVSNSLKMGGDFEIVQFASLASVTV